MNPYEIYQAGLAGAEQGKQRGLASLLGKAYSAPIDQRQNALARIAQVDGPTAFDAQTHLNSMDDRARTRLGQDLAIFDALPDEMKAQAYPAIAKSAQAVGIPVRGDWNPADAPHIQKLAQTLGIKEAQDGTPAAIRELQMLQANPELAKLDLRRRQAGFDRPQLIQTDQGYAWATPDGAVPLNYGGQQQAPQPGDVGPSLIDAVIQQESGGNPNAVSPVGAQGLMQVMPGTSRDPGFGVTPARDGSPQENVRVGSDYLKAMLQKYGGNVQLALAAYNAGPGRVDKAMGATGGDTQRTIAQLPRETQQYVPSVIGRTQGQRVMPAPKAKAGGEQYTTLSADEVAAAGLPAGSVVQRSPSGQLQIVNKPKDLPTGGQVIDNGDGTTTFIPQGKTSEGERNAAGFYGRMDRAMGILDGLKDYDPTNAHDRVAANVSDRGGISGALAHGQITPTGQKYQQAAMDWVRAKLRKESGAAIGKDEARQEYETYFPVYGDSAQVIEQKRQARVAANQAMRTAAGGAMPPTTKPNTPAASGKKVKRTGTSNGRKVVEYTDGTIEYAD
jgi:soluble lytic murein transglycosylase-like protein